MKKVTVELEYDTVDGIVVDQLVDTLENLQVDLENRKAGHGLAIFEHDKEADVNLLTEHVESFITVLSYFGYKAV